jgi:transporter family-2 protein
MLQVVFYALMAVGAGALFPVQSAANAWLGRAIGGPVAATLVSFVAGLAFLIAINAAAFRQWPSATALLAQPAWLLAFGGALGATFLCANVYLAPRFGAAPTIAFVMAGQLASALIVDRIGLFGLAVRELSLGRVGGVALVVLGALLVRLT